MGLMVEDGIPDGVDMDDYDGLRGISEVLSWSTPASEILELADVADRLRAGKVAVIRTVPKSGGTRILSNNYYYCLDEAARRVFAICDTDKMFSAKSVGIVQRFVWMAIHDRFHAGGNWPLLTVLKSVTKNLQLTPFVPELLQPGSEMLKAFPDWWGLDVPATQAQINLFAGAVAAHCVTWERTPEIISIVQAWLYRDRAESFATFDDLYNAFRQEDPLAPYGA